MQIQLKREVYLTVEIHLVISLWSWIEQEVTKGAYVHDCGLMLTNDCNCGLLKCKQWYKRTIHVRTTSCLICVSHPGTSTAYALRRYKANNWERRNAPLHYPIWSREADVSVDQQTLWYTRSIIATYVCNIYFASFEILPLFRESRNLIFILRVKKFDHIDETYRFYTDILKEKDTNFSDDWNVSYFVKGLFIKLLSTIIHLYYKTFFHNYPSY